MYDKILIDEKLIYSAFWSEAGANAVLVEADAFKETDVFYRAISSRGHHNDMLQTAELVLFILKLHFTSFNIVNVIKVHI